MNVSERSMHGKWDFMLFGIDNSKRNMTFIITIKAIMTVREMTCLTCQDFKKGVHL